jgi:hypothetical protein
MEALKTPERRIFAPHAADDFEYHLPLVKKELREIFDICNLTPLEIHDLKPILVKALKEREAAIDGELEGSCTDRSVFNSYKEAAIRFVVSSYCENYPLPTHREYLSIQALEERDPIAACLHQRDLQRPETQALREDFIMEIHAARERREFLERKLKK